MPNISVTQNIGFTNQVADYLEQYKPQLVAKNVDPTANITLLRTLGTDLSQLNQEQETIKTDLKNKTLQVDAKHGEAYDSASTLLDMAIGALGKTEVDPFGWTVF